MILYFILTWLLFDTVTAKNKHLRIIGGKTARQGQFPFIVSIHNAKGSQICVGSILGARYIVTTAHCVHGRNATGYIIQAGTTDINLTRKGQSYKVRSIKLHKKFNSSTLEFDVAIMIPAVMIKFNQYVQKINLGPRNMMIPLGSKVTTAGWGRVQLKPFAKKATHLQYITLTIVDNARCLDHHLKKPEYYLCARGEVGHDVCYGDVGAPMIYNGYLVGILSYFRPCAVGGATTFGRVSSHSRWISRNMHSL